MTKIYVTCNDKSMSRWGLAENKINKLIIECNDITQANRVMNNLKKCQNYKYINYHYNKPNYTSSKYYISEYIADNCPLWNK